MLPYRSSSRIAFSSNTIQFIFFHIKEWSSIAKLSSYKKFSIKYSHDIDHTIHQQPISERTIIGIVKYIYTIANHGIPHHTSMKKITTSHQRISVRTKGI